MSEKASLLKLEGINTYYGQIHILQNLSLEVRAGELVCLLGGNASGKSTTLKTILGIVRPRTGVISFAGEEITTRTTSHRIGRGIVEGGYTYDGARKSYTHYRKVRWTVTNSGPGGLPGVELVLPHVALMLLNVVAIVVGINALRLRGTPVPGVVLSTVWAAIYVVVLGRIIAEAVIAPQQIKARLERRKAGAIISRALPWPSRGDDADEVIDLTVEQTSRPTSPVLKR